MLQLYIYLFFFLLFSAASTAFFCLSDLDSREAQKVDVKMPMSKKYEK